MRGMMGGLRVRRGTSTGVPRSLQLLADQTPPTRGVRSSTTKSTPACFSLIAAHNPATTTTTPLTRCTGEFYVNSKSSSRV